MGNSLPSTPPTFETLQALTKLETRLRVYLDTVEKNTAAVTQWLEEKREFVLYYYHRLDKAIESKNSAEVEKLLMQMGDVAGFVVGAGEFKKRAEQVFGKDDPCFKRMDIVRIGVPGELVETLPEFSDADRALLAKADQETKDTIVIEKKAWSGLTGWHNRDEKEQLESWAETQRQISAVKADIFNLGKDQVEAAGVLASAYASGTGPLTNFVSPVLIDRPKEESKETIGNGIQSLLDAIETYSRLTRALEKRDAPAFLRELNAQYPGGVPADPHMHETLLVDYAAESMADLILKNVRGSINQAPLLEKAMEAGTMETLAFADAKTPAEIFEKFLALSLDTNSPMPTDTLSRVVEILKTSGETFDSEQFTEANAFQRISERFTKDFPMQKAALEAILCHAAEAEKTEGRRQTISAYIDVAQALAEKKAVKFAEAMESINQGQMWSSFEALRGLCQPQPIVSMMETICTAFPDAKTKIPLLATAANCGLILDAEPAEGETALTPVFHEIMEKHVLTALDKAPLDAVQKLLNYGAPEAARDDLRHNALVGGGWIEAVVSSTLDDKKKQEWLALLMAPFPSKIAQANILDAAASNAANADTAATLTELDHSLVGGDVRLSDDVLLRSLPEIANVWYSGEALRYTVAGKAYTLMDNVTPETAAEVLHLLGRRGGFLSEEGGLFRPEKIDVIQHAKDGSKMAWYNTSGPLNTSPEIASELQNREDFVHNMEAGSVHTSYNLASICLVETLDNGAYRLIDKYGQDYTLEGDVTLPVAVSEAVARDGVYFNPANAAILRVDPAARSVGIHIESAEFDTLLTKEAEEGAYYHTIKLTEEGFQALGKTVAASDHIFTPGGAKNNLYFNMKQLSYLAYNEDENDPALECKRYSSSNKPGVIAPADDALETIRLIVRGLQKKAGVLRAGNVLFHKDGIDDVYHDADKEKLVVVMGSEIQEIPVDNDEGRAFMTALAADPAFTTVAVEPGRGKNSGTPADIVQLGRALSLSVNGAEGRVNITTPGAAWPFYINMDEASGRSLLDQLEQKGLPQTSARTPAPAAAKKLKAPSA